MKIISRKKRLCFSCMEEHEVSTVKVSERTIFKKEVVEYESVCFYCDKTEEFYMNEEQMRENDIMMKEKYRESQGLLLSKEIYAIREKYGISQSDLCLLLGWGKKTITRYESHQVQDRAHDTILKKIDQDPEWFLELLETGRSKLSLPIYEKYYETSAKIFADNQDLYLRKSIEARYIRYQSDSNYNGNVKLSLEKVVDMIKYFASSHKVTSLYKVKLMKLMWYADVLAFKKRGHAISGLVYQALPMGAVPVAHESIIDMKGVPCEEEYIGDTISYHFIAKNDMKLTMLSKEDIEILDVVIDKFGSFTREEIVNYMHNERAYIETKQRDIIEFQYAKFIQL